MLKPKPRPGRRPSRSINLPRSYTSTERDGIVLDARKKFEFPRPFAAVSVFDNVHERLADGREHVFGEVGVDVEDRQEGSERVTQRLRRRRMRETV